MSFKVYKYKGIINLTVKLISCIFNLAALLSIDLPMRDTEYPAGKFLSGLLRLKIMNSISEKEKNMLLTAISRAPSSGLVNIPLFIQIWNHWYLNKDTLIEDKIDMNENEKQIYYLIKLKYDKLLHIIETLSIRLKSGKLYKIFFLSNINPK